MDTNGNDVEVLVVGGGIGGLANALALTAVMAIEHAWVLAGHVVLRDRDLHDYSFTDWLYGPTALTPEQEPPMFTPIRATSASMR